MDIKIVNEQNIEEKPQVKELADPATLQQDGAMMRDIVGRDLFDFRPNEIQQYKGRIDTLLEWAKSRTEDHSPENLKWELRSLSIKLGTPPMTEKLIEYLYRYVYLDMETKRIEKEKERFIKR